MAEIAVEVLRNVDSRESLFKFLEDSLRWHVDAEDPFTYTGPDLHGETATRVEVSQIVPFSSNDPFVIMLAEFQTQFRRSDLREILRSIRADMRQRGRYSGKSLEEIIFVCATENYRGVKFAHFKEQEGRQPKISVFGWERERADETRTLRDYNLPALKMPSVDLFDELDWTEDYVKAWCDAWNVEQVTNAFYREYERVFDVAEEGIKNISGDAKRMFTQKLFNRLLFIRFLEKKNWLEFNERHDYLQALWDDYKAKKNANNNFYRDRLKLLFFTGLNNRQQKDLMIINGGGYLCDVIGDVPYLNGGLFNPEEDKTENERYPDIFVPDEAIEPILKDVFYAFNFTITESTPDDIEVAVDPEMLGRVFEELVTKRERKGKGSYYTPRTVVSFMCREALKGYLKGYETLVDEHDASDINVPSARELLQRLDKVKVVDPACGSGAYLLGILHELHALMKLLDVRAETPRDDYKRKLAIIERNIYGVDIDDFAVNIARLRLWLSLAVEYSGDKPEPLPNLDFKIEQGDSLTAHDPSSIPGLLRNVIIEEADEIAELKADFSDPYYNGDKVSLKATIQERLRVLSEEEKNCGEPCPKGAFDWRVQFAEVFKDGGFDIVIANPPYGATVADEVRNLYFDKKLDGSQSKDTYGLFMARALQLMRSGGQFSFIVSDTWRTIKSHRPLRKRLLEQSMISHVLDLPPWIFKATVNTCILTLEKNQAGKEHNLIAGDLREIQNGDWQSLEENLRAVAGHGVDCQTTTYARYTYRQSQISTYRNLSLYIGSPRLYSLMSNSWMSKLEESADVKVGLQTSDNEYYLRTRPGVRGSYQILDETRLLSEADISSLTADERQNVWVLRHMEDAASCHLIRVERVKRMRAGYLITTYQHNTSLIGR